MQHKVAHACVPHSTEHGGTADQKVSIAAIKRRPTPGETLPSSICTSTSHQKTSYHRQKCRERSSGSASKEKKKHCLSKHRTTHSRQHLMYRPARFIRSILFLPRRAGTMTMPRRRSDHIRLVHLLHGEHPAFSLGLVDHLAGVPILVARAVFLPLLAPPFLLAAHLGRRLREICLPHSIQFRRVCCSICDGGQDSQRAYVCRCVHCEGTAGRGRGAYQPLD